MHIHGMKHDRLIDRSANIIANFTNLTLWNDRLTNLPEEIGSFVLLKYLSLYGNIKFGSKQFSLQNQRHQSQCALVVNVLVLQKTVVGHGILWHKNNTTRSGTSQIGSEKLSNKERSLTVLKRSTSFGDGYRTVVFRVQVCVFNVLWTIGKTLARSTPNRRRN